MRAPQLPKAVGFLIRHAVIGFGLSTLLMAVFAQSGVLAPERLVNPGRAALANLNGLLVLLTLFVASAQVISRLTPDSGLPALAMNLLFFVTVLQLGAVAAGDQAARATVRAECCEALVGAVYEGWGGADGGLKAVHHWLDPHWRQGSAALLADPLRHNWKSALQEWSQGQRLGLPAYGCTERSRAHGDPRRFHCQVRLEGGRAGGRPLEAEGWGGSRREAEQQAARHALEILGLSPAGRSGG